MLKKIFKSLYKILPLNFQQRILEYQIKKGRREKTLVIEGYQKKYGHKVLIETGTFLGDMVESQRNNFQRIFSIELQPEFAEKARERFKEVSHITILQGDSSKLLKIILSEVNEPAIFWLDAHYSGGLTAKGNSDCPIFEELEAIFEQKRDHILLIDDARYFNGQGDYPDMEQLTSYIQAKDSRYKASVQKDIIRYTI